MSGIIKPRRLKAGDTVAAVSPSWGGPGAFPRRYQAGKRQMEQVLGIRIVEMAHTTADPDWLSRNPQARADDLMAAFADPRIDGIFATIGGDDAIRLLPYLDLSVIRDNPKVFLGFSDTTALHLACYRAGLGSFYGPSIMAGGAENGGMHAYTLAGLRRALFSDAPIGPVLRNDEGWTAEKLDWADPANQLRPRRLLPADPPRLLQGHGTASGHMLGGCLEVLEMAKFTPWWPDAETWQGALIFLETSEESPSPDNITRWLRNYAATGILGGVTGLLLARADPGDDPGYQHAIEAALMAELDRWGLSSLPVLTGLDFGHTQPMLTLPYGAMARIDCDRASLTILDAAVS